MSVVIAESVRFVRIPVFAAPSLSLATNRMVQNGKTTANSVKYATTSPMLNQIPYSCFVVVRAIIS